MIEASDIISKIQGKRVLVLGDAFVDEYVYGDCHRISQEAPVPIFSVKPNSIEKRLGGAANAAANVASLGGKPVLIARLGNDGAGDWVEQYCHTHGIELLRVMQAEPTICKTRVVAQKQQILRMDKEVVKPSGLLQSDIIETFFKANLGSVEAVIISDYAKGFFTKELCQKIIEASNEVNKLTVVDPKPDHHDLYVGCALITPNVDELKGLTKSNDYLDVMARKINHSLGSDVIVTRGPDGLAFFSESESDYMPSVAQDVFDVSGAGDTVVAAVTLALAANCPVGSAMRFANLAAGVAVSKHGTYAVKKEDILNATK